MIYFIDFITLCALASCGAVYPSCLWVYLCASLCVCVCLCVSGSVTTITRNCVHRCSPNWVCIGKGSDHLQLIKFWPSRAPGLRQGEFGPPNNFWKKIAIRFKFGTDIQTLRAGCSKAEPKVFAPPQMTSFAGAQDRQNVIS